MFLTRRYNTDGLSAPTWPFTLNRDSPQTQGLNEFFAFPFGHSSIHSLGSNASPMTARGTVTTKVNSFGSLSQSQDATAGQHSDTNNSYAPLSPPFTMGSWFVPNNGDGQQALITQNDVNSTNNQYGIILEGEMVLLETKYLL